MDLVQNLKWTLKNMGERVLRELFFHYIRQKAKLTLKKRDNSLQTEFSRKHLTAEPQRSTIATSSTDTSEKTIMDQTTEEIIGSIRQWSIDRIHELSDGQSTSPHQYMDAVSIAEEFDEWIECEGNPDNELDILYLEMIRQINEWEF